MGADRTVGRDPVLPASQRPPAAGPALDAELLVGVLARAAGADDVAAAVLSPLLRDSGVRAALVATSPRPGADPVVQASAGYDCATMAAGAVLPLDAGLPATECVRTGQVQVVGSGPSWAAVPAGPGTVVLLSLDGPPPADASLAVLVRLGRLLAGPLARVRDDDGGRDRLAVLEQGLAVAPVVREDVVVRLMPFSGSLSGDVAEVVDDDGARWLLLADVCGRGAAAAVGADRLRAAFRACAPGSHGPADVLRRLDRVLQGAGEEAFATALVLRCADGLVQLASAGHPAPLLLPGGRVDLVPGPPLGLGLPDSGPAALDTTVPLDRPVLLLAATDGLTDRGHEVDLDAVVAGLALDQSAQDAADEVVAACLAQGRAQDDATLLVARLQAG